MATGAKTVRRAARIRNALVLGRKLVVVDAENAGQVRIIRRSADHDLLGAGGQVAIEAGLRVRHATAEDAGAFENDVDAEVSPRQFSRVANFHRLDFFAIDDQVLVVVLDRAVEATVNTVVLQQGCQRLVVGQVVNSDDFEDIRLRHKNPEDHATNSTKSIDTNADCHYTSPLVKIVAPSWGPYPFTDPRGRIGDYTKLIHIARGDGLFFKPPPIGKN